MVHLNEDNLSLIKGLFIKCGKDGGKRREIMYVTLRPERSQRGSGNVDTEKVL